MPATVSSSDAAQQPTSDCTDLTNGSAAHANGDVMDEANGGEAEIGVMAGIRNLNLDEPLANACLSAERCHAERTDSAAANGTDAGFPLLSVLCRMPST